MHVLTRIIPFSLVLGLLLIIPTGVALADSVVQDRQGTFVTYSDLCNGAELELEGTYHFVVKDNNDGTSTFIVQIQASGTSAGNEYVLNLTRKSVFVGGSFELTGDAHDVLVSKGSASNQLVTFHFDFTVSPPVISFDVDCVG
jgi:hypothetical protein